MALSSTVFALLGLLATASDDAAIKGFLIISAPRSSRVSYIEIPEDGDFSGRHPKLLIDTGLQTPQGVAVDHKRKRLYVADPDSQKIFSYQLTVSDNGKTLSTDGQQKAVTQNMESRWVTVDGMGTLFFSDEPKNLIMKISPDKIFRGDHNPTVVYNGNMLPEVSRPGGVAADNFHVFWTNKHFGTEEGSVVRGSEAPTTPNSPLGLHVLSRNTVKSYGVCLALGNVYFTDDQHNMYGVKKEGGPVKEVSKQLSRPRGCVWDGDGTIFVADRGNNAVYSFAGNMQKLGPTEMSKAFDFEDAFGLTVFLSSAHGPSRGLMALIAATASWIFSFA